MRFWKRIVRLCALSAASAVICGIGGCQKPAAEDVKELRIIEPETHLASWREELPQDREYTAWDAGAVRGLEIQKEGETVFAVSYEPEEGKETFDYWDISVPYRSMVSVNTEELYGLFDAVFRYS